MGIIPHKGYNAYTLENHSTADLYYDATTGYWGVFSLPQALCFTMQPGCRIVIHPRVYELSRVRGGCTCSFSFEVWLHHIVQNNMSPVVAHSNLHTYLYNQRVHFDQSKGN